MTSHINFPTTTPSFSKERLIVEMQFGSHLYGTNTPASDMDIKAVHIPAAHDILLQRVRPVISWQTKAAHDQKNTSEDTDYESYSLQKYLTLVAEGQTVALDMLFAPDHAHRIEPDPLWREIQANKHRLLTAQYSSFVGYCRQQANKYGIKGSRMAAARAAVEYLGRAVEVCSTTEPLGTMSGHLEKLASQHEHISVEDIPTQDGRSVRHLVVCNRKAPFTSSIKNAYGIYKSLFDEYGKRALAAESNNGVDWKALSHAVRIGRQALEVLTTAHITFPRPEAAHLRAIKAGQLEYASVADEIEHLLVEIETTAAKSLLRAKPDHEWIDAFVDYVYGHAVTTDFMARLEVVTA